MKFVELTENEYRDFIKDNELLSFLQLPEMGALRQSYGTKIKYLGVKEGKKVLAASMFMILTRFKRFTTYYAPKGFLLDYKDSELLKFYTEELVKYVKEHNGFMIKMEPNIDYQRRDINGDPYPDGETADWLIKELKELGYVHYGFNTDFLNTQSRWNFKVTLDVPYEELKERFSKSTRKNIESTYKKGISVRVAKEEDLESMEDILIKTAERKKFKARDLEYYRRMYKYMGDNVRFYIAYLEPKKYIECSKVNLEEANKKLDEVHYKMEKDMVGEKLRTQEANAIKQVNKCEDELAKAEELAKEYPSGKDIGVLISVKSGNEYLTLYSGYLTEFARFTPKYAMYNEHIKDAYKFKMKYCNFYGISGIFDPKDKNYGMYEFKRGFGGEVQELVGEFTYPVTWIYHVHHLLRKIRVFFGNIKEKLK